jgi:hypothetical protein
LSSPGLISCVEETPRADGAQHPLGQQPPHLGAVPDRGLARLEDIHRVHHVRPQGHRPRSRIQVAHIPKDATLASRPTPTGTVISRGNARRSDDPRLIAAGVWLAGYFGRGW